MMPQRRLRTLGTLLSMAILLATTASVSSAQTPGRFLGRDDIRLYGIGLRVEPAHQTVPRDIATIVSTFLQAPAMPDGLPPFAPDAVIKATLRGPSFATPRELTAQPNTPFEIPPLTVAGLHSLDNIRLESGGTVLLRGAPESVTIDVIDRLLITQVTARALSAAEIREKGIVFDHSNFQAYNFSAAFAIEERRVELNFPVLLPQVQGAADTSVQQASIPAIAPPNMPTLQTIIPDTLRLQTQIPNLKVVGFTLTVPNLKGQDFLVPPIPGVIVIPGDIGFLNQFFSVMLMVGNVAPAGSNLVVDNLRAEIVLPPGYDQVVGSADDPLAMARNAQGETARIQAVVQAGPDGALGTSDDIVTIGPGESGNAEYLVEGRREGSHVVEMEISGTLHGLPIGPVPIRGRAAGAVLVRNPKFTLTFTHPEAVAAGEPYSLDVTVSNTSESPANFVTVSLYPRNVSGATIVGEPSRSIENIPPGDSATISFDLVSRITGKVTAATLDSNENVAGRFELKTAVGELGVPVSPDSLVLPKEASGLPVSLRQATIGLLGKAWAVATAPAAALPPSVQRFSKKIVIDRAIETAAAGFRVTLHESVPDSAAQLWMDFTGSLYTRLGELYPQPGDLTFAQSNFQGFDALRRASVRGDTFAASVGALLAPTLQSSGAAAFHHALAERWLYRPQFMSLLVSGAGALPYTVSITDAQGRRIGGTDEHGKIIKQIPYADVMPIGDAGSGGAQLFVLASPDAGAYTVAFDRIAGVPESPVTISVVLPNAAGELRQAVYNLASGEVPQLTGAAGDPFQFSVTSAGTPRAADATSVVVDLPPSIIGALQLPDADKLQCDPDSPSFPIGRVIGVLFSEEVTPASVQDRLQSSEITNYLVGGNKVVSVALQPGGRIAFLALRDPIGIYIDRDLTIAGVMDLRGQAMPAGTVPIEAVLDHGGVVSGQVLQADGTIVPYADVRLFYLMGCEEPVWVGISAKTADSQGRYSFDFVSADFRDKIVVVNPDDDLDFRHVPFTIARSGQRLNVDIVFLGRGTIAGRTLNESGAPLADTSIRITSLTDQSQFGVKTDAQGRFSVAKVPVGNIFIEAVNTSTPATLKVSDYIPFAGATVTRDLILLDSVVQETTVQHGDVRGHVFRADGVTPAADVPVIVYYEHLSQPNVRCPGSPPPSECAVALMNSGVDGAFSFDELPSGHLHVYAFDQGALSDGDVRFILNTGADRDIAVLLNGGLATVQGIVLDPNGQPVAGARVGGGLSLSTSDSTGRFTLVDVPIGKRDIVAVSDTLGTRGKAAIDIVRAGEAVNVTIVLSAVASIGGVVYQPDGLTPIANQAVYAFKHVATDDGDGVQVVGTATTNTAGGYRIDHIPVGDYFVSAVNDSLNDGNIIKAKLRFHGQVFRADIRFRGAGTVQGMVLDDDGQTPLRGMVGISGDQLVVAGNRVAVEFKHVQYFKVAESDFTTGRFSFPGVWVGKFTLSAAGAFSPDPISFDGVVPAAGATVEVNLRLQATSQIAGVVYRPDGTTPVGAGTIVRYKSDAFRVVCREDASGDDECESIPQGIQNETVITGDDGRFWLPIVNAGQFTITVEDVATGRTAEAKGTVRAGDHAEMAIRLMGLGDLTVHVFASDGVTPIPGARVRAEQVEHPHGVHTFTADTGGSVEFSGGDAFSEGTVIVMATDQRNGFTGRASARIEHDGQQVSLNVYLFNATGSISGALSRSDGLTPVPNAEIVISQGANPLALLITDSTGHFSAPGIPLGDFVIEAFEAATARRAAGSGRIDLANQDVPVNLRQLAIGMVKGTLLLAGPLTPLKAWTVMLNQPSTGGILRPALQTTTGLDGTYQFPGAAQGAFNLDAFKADVHGRATGNGAIAREGQIVDVPLIANVIRPLFGRVQGLVSTAVGQPAPFSNLQICHGLDCRLGVADGDGAFAFDDLPLGRWVVNARAQTAASAGSAAADLLVDNDVADVRIVLSGVSAISGVVERNSGAPAAFAELTLEGYPNATCGTGNTCTRFADGNGAFSFTDVAAQRFTITAIDPVSGLRGAVGGTLLAGESRSTRIVLQPTAQVTGRVFKANGTPAAGVTVELHWVSPENRSLFVSTQPDGRFLFSAAPLVVYEMTIEDPIGPGTAQRSGQLAGDIDLGDMILDEAPPQVDTLVPAPSSTGVPRSQVVRITFTEPIRPGTATPATITLEGPQGAVTTILDVVDGDRVVTLRPLNPLQDETQYTVRVKPAILDRLGKTMVSEYVAQFRTEDITAPRWLDITPAPNTGGVSVYAPIRIPFSEPIVPTAFSTPFEMRDAANALVPGRLDMILGNTTLVFTPNLPINEDATYRIRLGTAQDLAGNRQAAALDFVITTTDRTPPQITGLVGPSGGSVIENDLARVTASLGGTHDVGLVDFYINGVMAFADRAEPFELVFQAIPAYGIPGGSIRVSAIATDTSGNRGSPVEIAIPVVADQPPAVQITAPAGGLQVANGARVTVTVRGLDDLGVTRLAYRAGTGVPQDAASRVIAPSCLDCVENFVFNVPLGAAPGTTIPIEASAVDRKGQVTAAAIVNVTVIDAVVPTVTITGATTGARVIPGQTATAVVTAQDPGAVASITFTVAGAATLTETRTVSPPQNSVVTSFTIPIPANAQPGQTVTLDAVAVDRAGNIGHADRVILPVADRNRPTLVLRTSDGSLAAVPGRSVNVIATAGDEIGVNRIELTGQGAFTFSDARQVSPPAGSAVVTFSVPVPANATAGSVLTLQGRAFDLSGNVSVVASLSLTVIQLTGVTLPSSVIVAAGDAVSVELGVPAGAPAGLRVDMQSSDTAVATVAPFVVFAAGETSHTIAITGVSGGTAAISASISGVERASMTATVRGGVVSGRVFDALLNPVAGVQITVTGGGPGQATETDADGNFFVEGVAGPEIEIRALDPVSQHRGFAAATMSRRFGSVDVNVILVPAGRVSGIVFTADATTATGAGARVDIFDVRDRVNPLATTFTADDGTFDFPLVSVGSYLLRASDTSGNLGETSITITASGEDRTANLVYLGRGQVVVRVRDGSGNPVANAALTFSVSTVFGWLPPTQVAAAADGTYTFENVPVGSFSITGSDPVTNRAGSVTGQITQQGQVATPTITVASYGSVHGTVYRSDGVTPVAGASVFANQYFTTTTDSSGNFAFPILSLGFVQLTAREYATNGVGVASTSLSTNGQSRTADIVFAAQGTLIATVVDAAGLAVPDARVSVGSGTNANPVQSFATTDASGVAVITHVQAGNFVANASQGTRSGSTSGAMAANQTQPVTIALAPTATIAGTLFAPDGVSPALGSVSVYANSGTSMWLTVSAQVGADGQFRFENQLLSATTPTGPAVRTYSLYAYDKAGLFRARVTGIDLRVNGEVRVANLTFVGLGTIHGRVLNPDSSSAGAVAVQLRSLHPVFGQLFYVTTDAAGFWEVRNVAVAPFAVRAGDVSRGVLGEAYGVLAAHGDDVGADIVLQLNAVELPQTRFDGNNTMFDVQADGSVLSGTNAAFVDTMVGNLRGAEMLELVAANVPTSFSGSTVGTIEDGGREVVTRQTDLAGLNVTRKIYVPRDGYFARYLETLSNPGIDPITVDVSVRSRVRGSSVLSCNFFCSWNPMSASVITTSSGDATLSIANPVTADRWVVLDDATNADPFITGNNNIPALAFVFDGQGASQRVGAATFTNGDPGIVQLRWNQVTVPPGGTVSLMHFVAQQTSRSAATASAVRLAQMPPEALDGLSPEEVATIVNFTVPADGVGAIEPLASTAGTVTGRIFEGDGTTPVPNATVNFMSNHPLFGRVYAASADQDGRFSLTADFTDYGATRLIPIDAFTVWGRHAVTAATSATVPGAFAEGALIAEANVTLPTGFATGTVRRHNGIVVTSGFVSVTGLYNGSVGVGSDGTFTFRGLRAGSYTFTTTLNNPSGTGVPGTSTATIVVGQTADASIVLAATGSIEGVVRLGSGAPAVGIQVRLSSGTAFSRFRNADSGGAFRFDDVPAGTYQVASTEATTGIESRITVIVVADQTTPAPIDLIGVAPVRVVVTRPTGALIPGARVRLSHTHDTLRTVQTFTTVDGVALFNSIPVGAITVVVEYPQLSSLTMTVQASVTAVGQLTEVPVVLPAAGVVTGTVRFPSNAVAQDMTVFLSSANPAISGNLSTSTDASGVYRFNVVPSGSYTAFAQNLSQGVFGSVTGAVTADNQTVTSDITLVTNVVTFPRNLFDANQFRFDIQSNGTINDGSNDAYDGGLALRLFQGTSNIAWSGNSTGLSEDAGTEIAIQPQLASIFGLNIKRKVFVPADGYMARYLEVLSNPTAAPITVDAQIETNLGSDSSTRVIATSSGDLVFGTNDQWLVTDDEPGTFPYPNSDPTMAHVMQGAGAVQPLSAAVRSSDSLTYRWNAITVPAGGRVILMHFASQHFTQPQSQAVAQRLVQLPPEALAGLDASEIHDIVNFAVPADGSSPLPPLVAAPLGTVSGTVTAHDATTPVTGTVTVLNTDLIFGRRVTTFANGSYSAQIRAGEFTVQANRNGTMSPLVQGNFAAGATTATANIVYSNTGGVSGVVRRPNGAPVTVSNSYVEIDGLSATVANLGAGGTYSLVLLPPGPHVLNAWVPTGGPALHGSAAINIQAGQTTISDVVIEATGTIRGTIRRPNGTAVQNVSITLYDSAYSYSRYAYSDANGAYEFADVRLGDVIVSAYEDSSGASGIAVLTVAADTLHQADVVLSPTGTVTGRVTNPDGTPAVASLVTVSGYGPYRSMYTASDGAYRFENVAAYGCCYSIRAYAPGLSNVYREFSAALNTDGEVVTHDFVLPARVTLHVFVANSANEPLYGANVYVNNNYRGYTDSDGYVTIPNVADASFLVRADHYTVGTVGYASGTITDADHGRVIEVRVVGSRLVTLAGSVFAADGATRIPSYVYIRDIASGQYLQTDYHDNGQYEATVRVNALGYEIYVYPSAPYVEGGFFTGHVETNGERIERDFTFPVSVIRGRATYRDGTPVAYPSVWVQGVGPTGSLVSFYNAQNSANGDYLVFGPGVGPFSILVQDQNGAFGTETGEITAIEIPVVVDVVMLATGTVQGVVMDGATPVPYTFVTLQPSLPLAPSSGVSTNELGEFTFPGVVVAPFTLNACLNRRCANVSGELTYEGESTFVTVPLAPPGRIAGVVFSSDGVTPAPNVSVELRAGYYYLGGTTTGAAGEFTFANLPDGNLRVTAQEYPFAASANVAVLAGRETTVSMRLGSSLIDNAIFIGDDGFRYDIDCRGRMQYGGDGSGNAYAYNFAYRLRVNNRTTGCNSTIDFEDLYREAVIGPTFGGGESIEFEYTRKIFVPQSGRFARYLEVIRNTTDQPRQVTVRVDGSLHSSDGESLQVPITPSMSGGRYAVTAAAEASTLAVGHVFGGVGGQLPIVQLQENDTFFSYDWTLQIPAHGSVAFMHFTAQREWNDVANAEAQAVALADLSDPDALAGLSPSELGMIVNFVAPGGVTPITGSVSGQVMDVNGYAVPGAYVYAIDPDTDRILATATTGPSGAYRFNNLSSVSGISLLALHPADQSIQASWFVTFNSQGELLEHIDLHFPQ